MEDTPFTFLDRRTPSYTAILERDGNLVIALADMDLYKLFTPRRLKVRAVREAIIASDFLLCDANLPEDTLTALGLIARACEKPLAAIAISPAKAVKLKAALGDIDILFMNEAEARALTGETAENVRDWPNILRKAGLSGGVVTRGASEVVAFNGTEKAILHPPLIREVKDVTGAGDAMASGYLAAIAEGKTIREALRQGRRRRPLPCSHPSPPPRTYQKTVSKPCWGLFPRPKCWHEPLLKTGTDEMTRPISPLLPIVYSQEVAAAKQRGAPIVALESTIITHGMPYPGNIEMAESVEQIIRDQGAVPATIAVIHGTLHIGLEKDQLEALAQTTDAMKVSRADIAFAIAERRTGATTVAATMIAAARAGIRVFATGGIGGVHKGAEETFDISADLTELAKTGVIVVCAGAKAILDIPKTLEVLETNGVPVVTFGSEEFPAFWSRSSGLASPLSLNSPAAIANFQATREQLGIDGGMLVANPVPEEDEIPREEMEIYINRAISHAERDEVTGKAVTPYLLGDIFRLTDGRSLETNIALVRNNAQLAAEIAVALS